MNNKMYEIKPLRWKTTDLCSNDRFEIMCDLECKTPFGTYYITKESHSGVELKYIFEEHFDEGEFYFETVAEAKIKAKSDWQSRILGALVEVH